ncbi:MAG: peptide chain release factor 2 [Gammaproteobacteria bacterium]|nr:peptide chain release factor 2 [Gammaproteobacteria bacterium]MBT6754830.1 peptide chain release factor 2 [Gammaproteobacteria bacterium]MBT7523392.1 peptide chain release factor 2 [Gammaproteobacteria bacterium]MBT7814268.1 peptide chain release factor 2 [Gammaproteobacteria bacterium]
MKKILKKLGGFFDIDNIKKEIIKLDKDLQDEKIWSDREKSLNISKEKASIEKKLSEFSIISSDFLQLREFKELYDDDQSSDLEKYLSDEIKRIDLMVEKLSFLQIFKGKSDTCNAFLDVQSGSGGTEAQDWAEMLLRMYIRWGEKQGFEVETINLTSGEVAGIKSATLKFNGQYAFGWLKTETGVHRLVRKSPFDSGSRRHTSFASIFVSPEIDDNIEIEIDPSDLRIDVYRASGAGGQHVNKTESAVRITHLKSGVVTQCQNGRSQHKNKDTAMKQLKAKLYEIEIQKKRSQQDNIENEKADIGWGSQIRSYVLDQSRIKDLRTNIETSNTQSVLDGNINLFIEASLKMGEK